MRVLLSIKPQFVDLILSGDKKFEFRKQIHKNLDVKTIVIYATKPVGKVVGEFTIKEIHQDTPQNLWKFAHSSSGISSNEYEAYFEGRNVAFAIEIEKVKKYKSPRDLWDVIPNGTAPQSFAYIKQ